MPASYNMRFVVRGFGCLAMASLVMGCGDEPPASTDGPLDSVSQAAVVCAGGDVLKGIDVSYYQGAIDWSAAADDGISFAVARVNHGDFIDPEFGPNWDGMKNSGLVRGAYQYFNPGGDPVEQATVFIDHVGTLEPGDLPGVLDLESHDGLAPAEIVANVRTWLDMVEAGTGRKPIIYTGSYFWNDYVGTTEFNDHPLWIAHYQTTCPNLPNAWDNWTMWQYSSTGSVAGIVGNVDRNDFNGTVEDLNDLAANGYRAEVLNVGSPVAVAPGQTVEVTLSLQNVGARGWSDQTFLATSAERDRASVFVAPSWISDNRIMAVGDVPPGESVVLTFELTAPAVEGSYIEHFNLVQEGVAWFSDTPPGGGPLDDEIAFDIVVSSSANGATGGSGTGSNGAAGGGIPSTGAAGSCNGTAVSKAPPGSWWGMGLIMFGVLGARRRRQRGEPSTTAKGTCGTRAISIPAHASDDSS